MTVNSQLGFLALALALVPPLSACRDMEVTSTTSTTNAEIAGPTAEDQGNARADVDLVRNVRQRIVADETLSIRAKNAVLVARDGVVTVRGDVADRVEQELLVAKVATVPGVVRVDDRLTFEQAKGKKE